MAAHGPEVYFRFAADNIALLRDVFYRQNGLAEGELRRLVARLRRPEQPSSDYIFRQLRELEIVEEMPGQTAFLELTDPWRKILGYLLREQRLTSVTIIQTYLDELQRLDAELSKALSEDEDSLCVILLDEIRGLIERLRSDSHDNRIGIIIEAMKFKSTGQSMAAVERYERIIRLWEKYIEPLRDIIDSRKEMDERLRSLEKLSLEGAEKFRADSLMEREFISMRFRVLRLLRDTMEDYRESVRELEPLYNEALLNSSYLRGATSALEQLTRQGVKSLRLVERLALPASRSGGASGLLSNLYLEAYLAQLSGWQPVPPQPIGSSTVAELPKVVSYHDVHSCLRRELPIDDTLEWLQCRYPELPLRQTLGLYGRLFSDSSLRHRYGRRRAYSFESVKVCTRRLKLEACNEK